MEYDKSKILKYTEYKKQQSLWLQIEDEKRTNFGTNTEQFCIDKYYDYLCLIGFKNEDIFSKILKYRKNIGTYHMVAGEFYNDGYNSEVASNINELMDSLI
jgi:hypothetical protein